MKITAIYARRNPHLQGAPFVTVASAREKTFFTGEHRFLASWIISALLYRAYGSWACVTLRRRSRNTEERGAAALVLLAVVVACAHACAATCYETRTSLPSRTTLLMRGSSVSSWVSLFPLPIVSLRPPASLPPADRSPPPFCSCQRCVVPCRQLRGTQ